MQRSAVNKLRLALIGLFFGLVPAPAQAQCAASIGALQFSTIQQAVDAANVSGATVLVSGTCNENVIINEHKHRLTLDGSRAGAGTRATINNLVATSSTVSIRGNGATVRNFIIAGGTSSGVIVFSGGTATIENNIIQNAANGININTTSSARIVNNLIQNNIENGILVQESSSARVGFMSSNDPAASPNTIQGNGANGIRVTASANARIVGNNISNNGVNGVAVDRGSQADAASNTIDGNGANGIVVSENSGANLGNATGETIFDLPNETNVKNGDKGVSCDAGAYVSGRLGTLTGNKGLVGMGQGCVNNWNN